MCPSRDMNITVVAAPCRAQRAGAAHRRGKALQRHLLHHRLADAVDVLQLAGEQQYKVVLRHGLQRRADAREGGGSAAVIEGKGEGESRGDAGEQPWIRSGSRLAGAPTHQGQRPLAEYVGRVRALLLLLLLLQHRRRQQVVLH